MGHTCEGPTSWMEWEALDRLVRGLFTPRSAVNVARGVGAKHPVKATATAALPMISGLARGFLL